MFQASQDTTGDLVGPPNYPHGLTPPLKNVRKKRWEDWDFENTFRCPHSWFVGLQTVWENHNQAVEEGAAREEKDV